MSLNCGAPTVILPQDFPDGRGPAAADRAGAEPGRSHGRVNAADLPLDGIRVLDLSRILAGPWCGQVLADLGADVIKVEHPGRGDDTRDWGLRLGERNTCYFNAVNRNKRAIGVDLGQPEGLAIVRDLAARSDVLIQNFKTGGADKLGLGYDALSALNPGLIYCSVAGYDSGRAGGDAARLRSRHPGRIRPDDDERQRRPAAAEIRRRHRRPLHRAVRGPGHPGGARPARRTGKGRHVELALFDGGLSVTSYYGLEALALGQDPPRYGNAHPSIVPYGVFEAADGPLVITVGNNAQFERFCRHRDRAARPRRRPAPTPPISSARASATTLLPIILAALRARPRALLLERLARHGIPCGEVLGLNAALTSRARRAGRHGLARAGDAHAPDVLAPPYRLDGERAPLRRRPPGLGQHTRCRAGRNRADARAHRGAQAIGRRRLIRPGLAPRAARTAAPARSSGPRASASRRRECRRSAGSGSR